MKNYVLIALVLISIFSAGCAVKKVSNFDECAAAGYPVMESYPRQCRAGDETFTEEIKESEPELGFEEAAAIAENSECLEKGILAETYIYNEITETWWIDLDMKPEFENKLCSPACVVSEETKTAEINWRCTGALPR
ncbi:hypothetical protein KY347_05835 [Candidatus Woesearchaeota archaeon]|nr:hypothetical protein [Candidatus Woesearchaeota archaeon]